MFLFPPRFFISISLFWLAFVLIAFSDAATDMMIAFGAVSFIGLWGLSWIARVIFTVANAHSQAKRLHIDQHSKNKFNLLSPGLWRGLWRGQWKRKWRLLYLGIEPIVLVGSIALLHFSVPTKLRLKLSEPALMSYIQTAQAAQAAQPQLAISPRQVGLFQVQETELLSSGTVRLITTEDFFDHAGFVYSPNQAPPVLGEDSYSHLYGDWWHWQRSW